ncbi:MAG: hypothetical protein AB1411_13940 [Nitrospirota bacterium]
MGNIALTTLVILVLAIPGYLVRSCYYSHEFTRQVLPKSGTDDIARAFLYALPFHFIGVCIVELWKHVGGMETHLRFSSLFQLLSGSYEKGDTAIVDAIYADAGLVITYFVTTVLYAVVIGHALRHYVWKYRLDITWPKVFEFRNPWLYRLLRPKVPLPYTGAEVFVFAEALTYIPVDGFPGKTRLYRGMVSGFTTEEDGTLKDLFLTQAQRGELRKNYAMDPTFDWKEITPSSCLVLKYSEIKNLNLTYVVPASSPSRVPARK